ncbi:hypothetical protein T265_04770 [Opisthorchis viverrini]|uniref:Uncharacterized protein n=1 Tax=Opisthorchis viverrini TaxID=6198 RepID=A0A074ZRD5_OPIVI|nr:hypothetical protein T265_04770 [Opisthorchis viverrini]KER28387.1 hypothetical protein T265_04770 [Opisthorchis viverrini]
MNRSVDRLRNTYSGRSNNRDLSNRSQSSDNEVFDQTTHGKDRLTEKKMSTDFRARVRSEKVVKEVLSPDTT